MNNEHPGEEEGQSLHLQLWTAPTLLFVKMGNWGPDRHKVQGRLPSVKSVSREDRHPFSSTDPKQRCPERKEGRLTEPQPPGSGPRRAPGEAGAEPRE